mgnify:CR=1 FL=1
MKRLFDAYTKKFPLAIWMDGTPSPEASVFKAYRQKDLVLEGSTNTAAIKYGQMSGNETGILYFQLVNAGSQLAERHPTAKPGDFFLCQNFSGDPVQEDIYLLNNLDVLFKYPAGIVEIIDDNTSNPGPERIANAISIRN